jgi:hypothetical protein
MIEVLADPGDLGLGNPGVGPERLDFGLDLAGRNPVQIGLHHDCVEDLVNATAPF